jgi:hypothetical protein
MSVRNHIVITGTGRTGTTFLVELLTHLGLDTGFNADDIVVNKHKDARAGLEYDIRKEPCPFIVKNPWFCDYASEVIAREDIVINHIFIPIRDLHAAAESRRHVTQTGISNLPLAKRLKHMIRPKGIPGGLWHTQSSEPEKQETILLQHLYKLLLAVSSTTIPVTFMHYPRIVKDSSYLFKKLAPILPHVSFESFAETFHKTVRPDLVHTFNPNDR